MVTTAATPRSASTSSLSTRPIRYGHPYRGRHDVSGEARDARGRWSRTPSTLVPTMPQRAVGAVTHPYAVSKLKKRLKDMGAPSLHEMVDGVHWDTGSSGGFPHLAKWKIDFTSNPPRMYRPLDSDDEYEKGRVEYNKNIKKYAEELGFSADGLTLHQLAYGQVPAEWGHDEAYLDHLRHWSQGSSLVTDTGMPYRLYHGTGAVFREFSPEARGSSTGDPDAKLGFFFTTSPEDAGFYSFYGMTEKQRYADTPNVLPVYVRLRRPLVMVSPRSSLDIVLMKHALQFASKHGFDGVVLYQDMFPDHLRQHLPMKPLKNVRDFKRHRVALYNATGVTLPVEDNMNIVAFDPHDVKSATGNMGTFDDTERLDRSEDISGACIFLKSHQGKPLMRKRRKPALKTGQEVHYRHPNYPEMTRHGRILAVGRDGCTVLHLDSGHEERVRHDDILSTKRAGKKNQAKTMAKSANMSGMEKKEQKKGPEAQPNTPHHLRPWTPPVVPLTYERGHAIEYQRPDMSEPRIGRIEQTGRDGAVVSLSNGAQHKVRWPDVRRRVEALVTPEHHQEAVEALEQMGVPMDRLETLIPPQRSPQVRKDSLERLAALAAVGVPIDMKRAGEARQSDVDHLLTYLTTKSTGNTLSK